EEYNDDYNKDIRDVTLIGKTIRNIDNDSTALIIPQEFAKELDIENSMVSMFLMDRLFGNRYLLISKHSREIKIN
ncbi:MAG: hypothetical protein L0H55_10775, partial [Candidatus Nitrosocosmicus sp.]|nr:hypothetical protein [Candidatus Nitrosocosmicus sp.]